jgi:hypothetical protein
LTPEEKKSRGGEPQEPLDEEECETGDAEPSDPVAFFLS